MTSSDLDSSFNEPAGCQHIQSVSSRLSQISIKTISAYRKCNTRKNRHHDISLMNFLLPQYGIIFNPQPRVKFELH